MFKNVHYNTKAYLIALLAIVSPSVNAIGSFSNVYFDGTTPYLGENQMLIFDGVRAEGNGLTLDDALRFEYQFDLLSLSWEIQKQTVYTGVGVFDNEHMAIDVAPSQPPFTVSGKSYQLGQTYTFTATKAKPFVATLALKPGHVISCLIDKQTGEYSYQFEGNNIDSSFNGLANEGIISGSQIILQEGAYTLTVAPRNTSSVKFSLKLFNANNRQLKTIENGATTTIYEKFATYLRDYAKYEVYLSAGQTLNLTKPSNSDIQFTLLNDLGAQVSQVSGLPLIYDATKSGNYYLFINNRKGWGGSYSGKASITTTPSVVTPITNKTRHSNTDKATAARPKYLR